ncbi:MAG: hypothetical protein KIT31_43275, partial [Deltaproteobacteria bacterium]|nr:hypothetical protein [Deltaproteobacteria bacterium]
HLVVEGGEASLAELAGVLGGKLLHGVRHLEVRNASALEIVGRLVVSGRIATIEKLTLDFHDAWDERDLLGRYRAALAHVQLAVPLWAQRPPYAVAVLGRMLRDTLARPDDAIALYEAHPGVASTDHVIALGRTGRRGRAIAVLHELIERHDRWAEAAEILAAVDELLRDGGDAELVQHRARALLWLRDPLAAIEALAALPPSASVHLLRGLAQLATGAAGAGETELGRIAAIADNPTHLALAWGPVGKLREVLAPGLVAPAEIAAAIAAQAPRRPCEVREVDRLCCAELAIVEAGAARDHDLEIARMHALADELRAPPQNHHDLALAVELRTAALAPELRQRLLWAHILIRSGDADGLRAHAVSDPTDG